jgi:hypothetical protein
MTTDNRVIRIRGLVDDILAGGVEIPVHRTTSCGLAAVAQGNWTNEHTLYAVYTGIGRCAILPYGSRRRTDHEGSRKLANFLKMWSDETCPGRPGGLVPHSKRRGRAGLDREPLTPP